MFGQSDPSRTEDPTKKRVGKAREKGSVPKSQEFAKLMMLIIGLILLRLWIGEIGTEMTRLLRRFLDVSPFREMTQERLYALFTDMAGEIAYMTLPVLLVLAVGAFFTMRYQVGKLWSPKVLKPNFQIFNIMKGIKKLMISPEALLRMLKSVGQAFAVGYAVYYVLKDEWYKLLPLVDSTVPAIAYYILDTAFWVTIYALIPTFVIGIIDLIYTRWNYNEQLKMTKQEVKDERRMAEGDPQIKAQQRQKMMESMQQRMFEQVPQADVVITNPTHYAVALAYSKLEAPAPVVVAKGMDHVAQKIKEIARESGVPIRENKPLAQALYKEVEIGDTIPEEMYKAVATILSQLNRMRYQNQ